MLKLFWLVTFSISLSLNAATLADFNKSVPFTFNSNLETEVKGFFTTKLKKQQVATGKFNLFNYHYEVEIFSDYVQTDADNAVKNNISLIKNAYGDSPTPYPGEITNVTTCEKFFEPVIQEMNYKSAHFKVVKSFVDDRFQLGVCSRKHLDYELCTALIYQPATKVYLKLSAAAPYGKASCVDAVTKFLGITGIK